MSNKNRKIYYDVGEDLERYNNAWCFIIVGGRNTGKTYGALKYHLLHKKPIVFVKRTNEDVDLLCSGNRIGEKKKEYKIDLSPYKSINRDLGTNILAYKIGNGIGGFYEADDEGAKGSPVGYLLSLNAIHKYKGFDLSECGAIVFDEFIKQRWEKSNRNEGVQVMELYKTVARDREVRGLPELKLICLANAVDIYNETCEVLEVTDIISEMAARGIETKYLEDRGIFIRLLNTPEIMLEKEKESGIYRAMHGTAWGRMAFDNDFAYNDFSLVKKIPLKGYSPRVLLTYKERMIYIYYNNECYYLTSSRGKCPVSYNLDSETGAKAFYLDYGINLINAAINGRCYFEKYSFYDLIFNYKKRFKV